MTKCSETITGKHYWRDFDYGIPPMVGAEIPQIKREYPICIYCGIIDDRKKVS